MKVGFDEYASAYRHVHMERDGDGVLWVRLHTDDGPLVWGDGPHGELGHCWADIAADPDNRVVVLTGTGDEFIARLDDSWVGPMTPATWDRIYTHGQRLLLGLLDIGVPMIAAVNGRASVHAEIGLLCDIVLAADHATFRDAPHFRHGTVAGDGVHVVWPLLLGANRGRYFLLTGQTIDADEARALGLVNEVIPAGALEARARELAADLARQPDTALRYTRQAMVAPLRAALAAHLGHGLALEGLGAYESWPTGD